MGASIQAFRGEGGNWEFKTVSNQDPYELARDVSESLKAQWQYICLSRNTGPDGIQIETVYLKRFVAPKESLVKEEVKVVEPAKRLPPINITDASPPPTILPRAKPGKMYVPPSVPQPRVKEVLSDDIPF